MTAIKEKLLAMIGDLDMGELGDGALLNILRDKLEAQKLVISELQRANAVEHAKLIQEREALRLEHRELRRNPNRFIDEDHYFIWGTGKLRTKIMAQIRSGRVSLIAVASIDKNTQEILREVSAEEFGGA